MIQGKGFIAQGKGLLAQFIHELTWDDIPPVVQNQARRCLLDTLGTAIAGRGTECSKIIHDYAAGIYPGSGAASSSALWQDGRLVSPPGAALANAMTIDSFDSHDGYKLVKGHAGAAVVPAVFATLPDATGGAVRGAELLTSLVVGYEIALRAGLALHATACDFHTSGAWNALGCAAVAARHLGLDQAGTRHALGTAEFYGPRSPMMRCIDFPTMVKDGTGWGALAGVSAGLLASLGFTGAPAATVEGDDVAQVWSDLGERWLILEVYFKPFAVCYWAQPAVVGALALQKQHHIEPAQIRQVRVSTFYQATCLKCREPESTDEAQYSLPYPVAAALMHGKLGLSELTGPSLVDPLTLRLARSIELVEDPALSARFPAQRFARVEILTADGKHYDSGETTALWEPSAPPTDAELLEKFRWLAASFLHPDDVSQLERLVWECAGLPNVSELIALMAKPISGDLYLHQVISTCSQTNSERNN